MAGFAQRRRGTALARRWKRNFLPFSRKQNDGRDSESEGFQSGSCQCRNLVRSTSSKPARLPLRRDEQWQTLSRRHNQRRKLRASRFGRQLDRGSETLMLNTGTRLGRYEILVTSRGALDLLGEITG